MVGAQEQQVSLVGQKVRDYLMLLKFRLTLTVVFSSVLAYLIAGPAHFSWAAIGILAAGGFLVTGASNALNQVLEKDFDRLMRRTADRPLAAGRMSVSEAVLAAGLMSLLGITLLAVFNPWAAFLGTLALVAYAFVYTPLKRVSPAAVVVGAVPGALPTLIGSVAAQGEITMLGIGLFALQFFWQFPHFWSIGWLGFDDYQKAGYKLMPAREGKPDPQIGRQGFIYTLFLLPLALAPWWLGAGGLISAMIALALTLGYSGFAWRFMRQPGRRTALQLMFYSFLYLPLVLMVFLADKM